MSLLLLLRGASATPVTPTHLTTDSSTSNVASYTTASITPTANRLVLIGIMISVASSPTPAITVSGCGLTWEQVDQTVAGSRTAHVFRAMGASPTTGALTITAASGTFTGGLWSVVEYDGADTTGANGSGAIAQSFDDKPASTNSVSDAFPTTPAAGNAGFAAVGFAVQETATAGTGWSGNATSQSAPTQGLIGLYASTCPANVSASWTTSTNVFLVGVEVKAAGGGSTNKPVSDTGSGAEDLSVTAAVPITDTGTAVDALTVSAAVTLPADSGTGVDALGIVLPVTLPGETGTATDAISVSVPVPLTDTGAATDGLTVTAVAVPLTDTGAAVDAFTVLSRVAALADTATAVDALTVAARITLADTASAVDALTTDGGGPPSPEPGLATLAGNGAGTATLAGDGVSIATLAAGNGVSLATLAAPDLATATLDTGN